MRVLLTGATGFIGGHAAREMSRRGHQLKCLARGQGADSIEAMRLPGVSTVRAQFTRPESWLDQVSDIDVVLNAVGIIRETKQSRFAQVHTAAPIALFEAAARHGVRKIIQISAMGADQQAASQYHRSKREADRRLIELGVPYVIFRPSLVYGPGDHSMTFFETLVTPPITLVPGDGQYRLQPLHVDDLVRAIVRAVEDPELRDVVLDVGGAEPITFDRLLDTLAHRVGKDRARKIHVPWGIMQVVANLTDRLGFGPISSDELSMLRRGNWADNQPFVDRLGFTPLPFDTGLACKPRTTADRWYSWLRPLKLPLRLSIAFVWLATGIISATVSADRGMDLLAQIGITGALANVALFGTSGLEIVIGTATAIGWRVRLMGMIQLFLIFGFTLILTVGLPHLWLDPFGPLTKNIPLIGATLAMMAVEE